MGTAGGFCSAAESRGGNVYFVVFMLPKVFQVLVLIVEIA